MMASITQKKMPNNTIFDSKKETFHTKQPNETIWAFCRKNNLKYEHVRVILKDSRLIVGHYCRGDLINKAHKICLPDGSFVETKNWIKIAKNARLHVSKFKKMIDGDILTYRGFYLQKNKKKVEKLVKTDRFRQRDHKNIEVFNWKSNKTILAKDVVDLAKRLNWSYNEQLHFYPVLTGKRLLHKHYCMKDLVDKTYSLVYPNGSCVKVKNWIRVAKENKINVYKFKKLLDRDLLYIKGFYLLENKELIPKILPFSISQKARLI